MAEEPTLGEVVRRIADLSADLRALRSELVRRDVYDAHRSTVDLQIRAVEAEIQVMQEDRTARDRAAQEDRTALRRLVYGALLTAGGGAVLQVVTAFASGGAGQ